MNFRNIQILNKTQSTENTLRQIILGKFHIQPIDEIQPKLFRFISELTNNGNFNSKNELYTHKKKTKN